MLEASRLEEMEEFRDVFGIAEFVEDGYTLQEVYLSGFFTNYNPIFIKIDEIWKGMLENGLENGWEVFRRVALYGNNGFATARGHIFCFKKIGSGNTRL